MDKYISNIKMKGKDKIKKASILNDISSLKGYMGFRADLQELEEEFGKTIGKVFCSFYDELLNKSNEDIIRESFAGKDLKLKPYKYEYSMIFNFYECLGKKDIVFGFIAEKGDIVAELTINIEFE